MQRRLFGTVFTASASLLRGSVTEPARNKAAPEPSTTTTTPTGGQSECKPKQDPHGVWNGSLAPGGVYMLTCLNGYSVEGNSSLNLSCTHDLQWPADPWCENTDDCAMLVHGCGPAGVCVDHLGWAECLCEAGAVKRKTVNGEVACQFRNESRHCGGRDCGAHGVCVDLSHFQDSFDSDSFGKDSYRCSCQQGFHDGGVSCVPVDCGPRKDPLGTWSGETTYLGEYTLECEEGAFLWGGTQQAITLACPREGVWTSNPVCRNPADLRRDAEMERFRFWLNFLLACACICSAAVAAGLTMGLVSLDERELQIIEEAELSDCNGDEDRQRLSQNKEAARRIAPILKDHHRLLVTLLLLNALANEALPIFLDEVMPSFLALLVSVTFVLLCGEILPSAIFTGPMQMTFAARFVPCVQCLQFTFSLIVRPMSQVLDRFLPHDEDQLYSRPEIKALLCMHSQGGDPREREQRHKGPSTTPPASRNKSRESGISVAGSEQPFLRSPVQESIGGSLVSGASPASSKSPGSSPGHGAEQRGKASASAPLTKLEAALCLNAIKLGETPVHESEGFCSLRICSSAFFATVSSSRVGPTVREAVETGKECVVVFRSGSLFSWPAEVHTQDIVGIIPLTMLMAEEPHLVLDVCCLSYAVAILPSQESILKALKVVASVGGSPCGYAAVVQRGEFAGIFDGERALMELLNRQHRQAPMPPRRLDPEVQRVVVQAAEAAAGSLEDSPARRRERRLQPSPSSSPGLGVSPLGTVSEDADSQSPSRATGPRVRIDPVAIAQTNAREVVRAQRRGNAGGGLAALADANGEQRVILPAAAMAGMPFSLAVDSPVVWDRMPMSSAVGSSPSGPDEDYVTGSLSSITTATEDPVSPMYSRNDGTLRSEIRRAFCEYEQDLEASGRRTSVVSIPEGSIFVGFESP